MYTTAPAMLLKTATQSFWNGYFEYNDPTEGLVYVKESTQLIETYARLGAAPMPEEWVAHDNVKVVPAFDYSAKNRFWKNAVRIGKELIEFQQWDEVGNLVANLGTKARAHKVKRLCDFLNSAHATAGADTQLYFDTDHSWPGADYTTVWDNDLTANIASPLAPTLAEVATAIRAIIAALFSVRDDRGDPELPGEYNPQDIVILYPPLYLNIINQLLTVDSITNPGDNDLKGRFTARMAGFLTTPISTSGVIFGFHKGSNRKPLILQQKGDIRFKDNLEGDEFRATGNAVFDAAWVGDAAPGDHGRAVRYEFT